MRLFFVAVLLGIGAVSHLAAEEERRVETEHLLITWKEGAASEAARNLARERGEAYYVAIQGMLGYEPEGKILISLEGDAEQPDGSWEYPRVDSWGRILLFRYTPRPESYFNALAHEMVHVFRFDRPDRDGFLEEGFAELVALRLDESLDGFPWYGFPVEVAAGQWVAREEDVPLATLRENHRELNLPCKAQSYSLRSSFFKYLGDTHGDAAVVEMANQPRAGILEDYQRFFGKGFDALVADWRAALMKAYRGIEKADELASQYRESPVQYMRVCRRGKEFR